MSLDAWLFATADHLRSELELTKDQCDVQPGGRPPAKMGEFYISIDEGSVIAPGPLAYLKEEYAVEVNITRRTGQFAPDRLAEMFRKNAQALGQLERRVIVAIHNSHALRQLACTLERLPDEETGDIFQQPLWYMGRGKTRPEAGDWAGSAVADFCFLVRTLPFRGGLREQAMDIAH